MKAKQVINWVAAGGALVVGVQIVRGNETFYSNILMPVVHRCIDPETAHSWAVKMAANGLLPRFGENVKEYPEMKCNVFGLTFKNPIGIAAGFDKNGEAIAGLQQSGFGFVEIGSVTPRPQFGNFKPRLFRLIEDRALINRYGFNSDGVGIVSQRVQRQNKKERGVPLGVNLGKNKDTVNADLDYEIGCTYFANHCDYLVINVSSPNTPGLRALQSKRELEKILVTVNQAVDRINEDPLLRPKILLKITSDLTPQDRKDVAQIVLQKKSGVDGLIISNTTVERPDTLISEHAKEVGGLSGPPLREPSTKCISDFYHLTHGQVPIIGCGGVESGKDAYEKIRAGASLIQLYTVLTYDGFPALGRVKRELLDCLRSDGFGSVEAAVGADHKHQANNSQRSWWFFW